MSLVSVIVPNYNHDQYLDRRIQSILNQTHKDISLIIMDDCSTDNSRDVIEKYRSHPQVEAIVYNDVNSGSTFKQWQKGFTLAKGKYIWIAESDDFCEPVFLAELVTALDNDDSLVLAYCQTLYVSTDNRITYRTQCNFLSETMNGNDFVASKMLGKNTIVNASMVVFKSAALQNVSDEYTGMKYCGDWLFWVNLCLSGNVYLSGKYLNYYLRHEKNVASNATRQGYDFLEGAGIFHYIKSRISVTDTNLFAALNDWVTEYLRKKDVLVSDAVYKRVTSLMWELDPRIKSVYRKRLAKEKMIRALVAFKKMLP